MFPGGTPVYKPYRYMPPQGVLFLPENGYRLCSSLVENRVWFSGELRLNISKWTRKKEKCANSKWILRNPCCSRASHSADLSNDDIIS